MDALFLELLTIYATNYGAFFATMVHLRVSFHIKQLNFTFPMPSPIAFPIIYSFLEYKMRNVQLLSRSAELKSTFYIGWCQHSLLTVISD